MPASEPPVPGEAPPAPRAPAVPEAPLAPAVPPFSPPVPTVPPVPRPPPVVPPALPGTPPSAVPPSEEVLRALHAIAQRAIDSNATAPVAPRSRDRRFSFPMFTRTGFTDAFTVTFTIKGSL